MVAGTLLEVDLALVPFLVEEEDRVVASLLATLEEVASLLVVLLVEEGTNRLPQEAD